MPEQRRPRRSWAAAGSTGRRQPPAPARADTEVDGERLNSALAPGDWGSERGLNQPADLSWFWEPFQLRLAEDELIVEGDFEPAFATRAQGQVDHDRRPCPEDLSRQTDGLLQVVSGNAVFDREAMLGIEHQPSVSAAAADSSQVRVLEGGWQLEPIGEHAVDADATDLEQDEGHHGWAGSRGIAQRVRTAVPASARSRRSVTLPIP